MESLLNLDLTSIGIIIASLLFLAGAIILFVTVLKRIIEVMDTVIEIDVHLSQIKDLLRQLSRRP